MWLLNERNPSSRARKQFGDLVMSINDRLWKIKTPRVSGADALRRASQDISVYLYTLLCGDPLINSVIRSPKLHPLAKPKAIPGSGYISLFKPATIAIFPPEPGGLGTGLEMEIEARMYPLPGLAYTGDGHVRMVSPWGYGQTPIKLDAWLKQPLVQEDRIVRTVREAIVSVRNQRGAHADRKAAEQRKYGAPVSTVCEQYIDFFILQAGIYVVCEAARSATRVDGFRDALGLDDALMSDTVFELDAELQLAADDEYSWEFDLVRESYIEAVRQVGRTNQSYTCRVIKSPFQPVVIEPKPDLPKWW